MTLRTRVLPTLFNGVSQQPPILRSPDQNEDELNTWASLADGVGKRPPTELVTKVAWTLSDDAFVHHINRDTNERYIVVIDNGAIKVIDHVTGEQKLVATPGGTDYIASGKFRAVTVADFTFIVNTSKQCLIVDAVDNLWRDPEYARWLNKTSALSSYTGMVGSLANKAVSGSALQYSGGYGSGTYKGELPRVEKLPETAANGDMYKITGSVESGFVSYYVRRNGAVWDETRANGLRNSLDPRTMPHCLVREADGTFTFAPFSWAPRGVGDESTNPVPTFVGRTIRDVFFYQNRLGLLVDENVVFSCTGDFGNFWRNTVLDYVASDVIDVAVTTNEVSLLNYALAFNDGIMAFADQTQFSITNGEDGLTPESVAIQPTTRYEVNTNVRPVTIGTEVYFCGDQNGSSVVWEYTRLSDGDNLTAAEITAHVPTYVPGNLKRMVSAGNLKALFALTGGTDVYVYQFYWNGNEKVQSAWRKWTFSAPVVAGEYIDGYLYLLFKRQADITLERVQLEPGAKPANQNHQVYLDRRVTVTGTYYPEFDRTEFVLPYMADPATFQLIRPKTHPSRPGSLIDPSGYNWATPDRVIVVGNESGTATGGERYSFRLTFSRQFPQDYQGRPLSTGRLQLRTFTLYYTGTAFFRTEVSPYGAAMSPDVQDIVPAKLAEFTGMVVGANDLRLNKPVFHTGSYSFQVYGDAAQATVTITNDTHVASTFVSAEWEGFYFSRSQ
ncbi:phage nozzle protein [Novosphingobium lindaniclasticum]|uniref:Tail tubular protein B n=1 Tax=Novosphingobium lindaniclasticum LE124 TaxID=1096930 RepID=T0ILA1_9SPHN|nr:hypothetical protein [Novosphingobium lindaniclasticum]EQB10419.1 hypothetical protein L284_17155 [Novosphingobium lindaniclasticum LE124]